MKKRGYLEISENLIIFAVMKHSQIFRQYIWIINTLRSCGGLTFEELNQKWKAEDVSRGKPLQRSSFNRHRDAILEMFGIIIDCDLRTYKYYIGNQEALEDDSLERWIYSTLTVHGALSEGASVKERLVLENAPAGERYLDMMIHAIRCNHRLRIGYQKFQAEGYEKTVCPYALKLFRQRWYLLARNDEDQMRIYALDRITSLCLTEETFEMPTDFSAQKYFSEYFGVLTNDTPLAHVVVRAHKWMPDYLRTLPLHHSQRELQSTPDYTDFSYDIRPTSDFLGELMRHSVGIEVLEPVELREKMKKMLVDTLERYS